MSAGRAVRDAVRTCLKILELSGTGPRTRSLNTPRMVCRNSVTCCPSCPGQEAEHLSVTRSRRSQPRTPQEPPGGVQALFDLSDLQDDHPQNPSSHLSRTASGQADDLEPGKVTGTCPRPLLSIERTGSRTAPVPDNRHRHKAPPKTLKTGDCEPRCLTCGRQDGDGHCQPSCATVCQHTAQPYKADVCITHTKADAWIVISPNTGYMHLHIRACPHCQHHHTHAPHDHPWRTAPCGRPYVLTIKEPETP